MSLFDKFLNEVTDEFGNKIDFSNVEVDGFDGVVFIGHVGSDLYIQEDHYEVDFTLFNTIQIEMIKSFIEYVQQKMKEHKFFLKDQINTQNSLK